MKHFISTVTGILNRSEKAGICFYAALDAMMGMLDIAFLGLLLLVINFYSTGQIPGNYSWLQSVSSNNALVLTGIFFILFSLKNWMGYRVSRVECNFFYGVASRLSERNIIRYFDCSYVRYTDTDSSAYFRKISQQPVEFSNNILISAQQIISQGILIFFTITGILFYHPALFLSLFILLLPPVIVLAYFIKSKLKQVRANIKQSSQLTIQHLQESLSGYIESNLYHKNDFFTGRFLRYQQRLNENIATQQTLQVLPARLIEVFAVLGFFILIAVNKLSAGAPAIDLLTVGVFMAAAYKIIPGIIKILNSAGQIKTYRFTLDDLAAPADERHVSGGPPGAIASVQFDNVSFKFNNHPVLNGTSFQLIPGDFAGMAARSGSGKTTIINLLLGFLEPDGGLIRINNKTAGTADRQRYRGKISYVKQQPFFIHDSILKNITLADDEYDRQKLEEVILFCGIDGMVNKCPEGLEKVIRENGKNISGGQRQRIMLARALYHDFDLLILDEPFGEIDDCSEKRILTQLQSLAKKGRMILFITHNKASLSFCNKIILMDEA